MIENSPLSKSTVIIGTGKIIKVAVAGKIKIAAIFSAWLTTLCNSDELSNWIFSDNFGKSTLPKATPTTPRGS